MAKIKVQMFNKYLRGFTTKEYLFASDNHSLKKGELIKVNTINGEQIGKFVKYADGSTKEPTSRFVRKANKNEIEHVNKIMNEKLFYGYDKEKLKHINMNVPIKNCQNANIKANIFSDERMRELGFTDLSEKNWFYMAMMDRNHSFSITIDKKTKEIEVMFLDEDFLQPYNYQKRIEMGNFNAFDLRANAFVQKQMAKLQDLGVIYGYNEHDYI